MILVKQNHILRRTCFLVIGCPAAALSQLCDLQGFLKKNRIRILYESPGGETDCLINFLAPIQLTVAKLPCFPISEIDWYDQCSQNWYKWTITIVSINRTCPSMQAKHTFFYAAVSKVHVFISVSDWLWHPEMFTEATRRQMRPQKSNACMTQASKCFCSTPHHWQCSEWQVQTQPSRPSIPVPAAAAVLQHTLTRCWPVFVPGTRCWRETLLLRH